MPDPIVSADVKQQSIRRRATPATLGVMMVALFVAVVFDTWYVSVLVSRERARVSGVLTSYASGLESAFSRRISRLSGLRTFVETRISRARLDEEFQPYAEGLRAGTTGIRALELVRNGLVQTIVPLDSNGGALGYDLYSDARPSVTADVRRAMETGQITVSTPVDLLQGGRGLVVRQRVTSSDSAFPDLVAMVLDLPALEQEASLLLPPGDVRVMVRDRDSTPLPSSVEAIIDPVAVALRIPDGAWSVEAAPRAGWRAAVAPALVPTRVASALIVALLVWVTYLTVGRQSRLAHLVEARTGQIRDANAVLRREVEERQAVEARLREQGEGLRLALHAGKMGPWEYDPTADKLTWSDSALTLLGRTPDETPLSGKAFYAMLVPESREVVRDAMRSTLRGTEGHAEYRVQLADGRDRWLYGTGEVLRDATGKPVRLIGILADVTERHQLEEQLLHSQKMEAVGTLAGGIAHDFNNLLTAIMGFTQLAQAEAAVWTDDRVSKELAQSLAEVRDDLHEILRAGERASMLTAQLLAFSRRQVVHPTRMDANVAVHDVERMLKRLIGERVTLNTSLSAEALPVRADQGQIAQLLVNLVVNARDAMPGGGHIRVDTERLSLHATGDAPYAGLAPGDWVILAVRDNGVGMSADVLARAFEPFFTTKPVGEGTGLGLSTVYGIVTQAGGRVFVESTPGVGTTVRVALPYLAMLERVTRTTPRLVHATVAGARVLVVEDESGLRRLVAEVLTRRGYHVTVATDGADALVELQSATDPYDLILSDMVMPGLDGAALAREIRRLGVQVPILFMSGYPTSPDTDGHAFIAKPFTPVSLAARVQEEIDRARARERATDGAVEVAE